MDDSIRQYFFQGKNAIKVYKNWIFPVLFVQIAPPTLPKILALISENDTTPSLENSYRQL